MRMVVRLGAALVAISFMGSLPVRGGPCEEATLSCRNAQPHPMNCCPAVHCHCCLSVPVQPVPNSAPARTNTFTGHETVKVAPLPVKAMFLTAGQYLNLRATARTNVSLRSAAGSYLLTHSFLI